MYSPCMDSYPRGLTEEVAQLQSDSINGDFGCQVVGHQAGCRTGVHSTHRQRVCGPVQVSTAPRALLYLALFLYRSASDLTRFNALPHCFDNKCFKMAISYSIVGYYGLLSPPPAPRPCPASLTMKPHLPTQRHLIWRVVFRTLLPPLPTSPPQKHRFCQHLPRLTTHYPGGGRGVWKSQRLSALPWGPAN